MKDTTHVLPRTPNATQPRTPEPQATHKPQARVGVLGNENVRQRHGATTSFIVHTDFCPPTDLDFPSTYRSRPVRHPGNSDTAPGHTSCEWPTKNFCKGLDHDTGTARAVLAAAVPESTQTGNFRPDNVHSIHPLFFTTFDAFPRPGIGFLVVFPKDMNRSIGSTVS